MKYWQEERWQIANRTNVPHLYLYTWIRISVSFDWRKTHRTLVYVILDILEVSAISIVYILGNKNIVFAYFFEVIVIIYISIKIDKDNRLIDDNKVVLWWKNKKQEKFDKEVQKIVERNRNTIKKEKTEEEKMKRMSRKQRKQYKR